MMNDKKIEDKKKYVFFTDPDVIVKRAEAASASTLNNRFFSSNDNKPLTKTHECQLQPHPFTFITAVKRKLAIAAEHELNKQLQQHQQQQQQQQHIPDNISTLNIDKMDFIKPLKVPDMKISPKNMDFSPRLSQKSQKISLAHRKLDFSQSEGSSFITSDEIEQLKTPDVSFTSSINKKKDHTRDNITKEKENQNRTKKLKNDDTSDNFKRRLIKHTSRKDYDDIQNKTKKNLSKENDFNDYFGKKTKQKILAAATTTTTTATASSLSSSSSSPSPPSTTSVAAAVVTTASTTAAAITTSTTSTTTTTTLTSKKDDDRKLKSTSLHSIKSRDRSLESRNRSYSSESISERNFKTRNNEQINHKYNDDFTKQRTSLKKQFDTKKNDKSNFKNSKNNYDLDDSLDCRVKDVDKSQQTGSTNSIDDIFMDPRRISFRDDSYSTQDEFCNLTTPDMNLLYRPRKRKDTRIIQDDLQIDTNKKNTIDDKNISLRHPTALHMQFQAELHLFDSYNQSLQQVMDVENCLYNVQQEKSRALTNDKTNESINQTNELIEPKKIAKEVQTQTANDIATQTDLCIKKKQHPSITYSRGDLNQLSLGSIDEYDDFENIDKLNKMRTMSEISLHETTSSIKTETGTEISISTRDVTCSFNKYLDLEMVQLIKDEEQMYDKIELLFKSREKTLNDRTRKLVKLEEQKKALRDTGQDSRISSVKKKQRALLLKLQQEKYEMNRLKELHKLASQERKLMLQKQRNMFNPTMSTKNILTKLKRTADCQSPRRLSGPMKGYDIRSNSSISSLVDSDKSHIEKTKQSFNKNLLDSTNSSQIDSPKKFEVRKGKFEEKMPKVDSLKLRCHQFDIDDKINQTKQDENFSNNNNGDFQEQKSESDTLVEDLTRKKIIDDNDDMTKKSKTTQVKLQNIPENNKQINKRKNSKSIKNKSSINVLSENILRQKTNILNNDDPIRPHKQRTNNKIDKNDDENFKLSKNSILEELDMNESQNSIQTLVKHSKALKEKNCRLLKDISNDDEDVKENYLNDSNDNAGEIDNDDDDDDMQNLGNISTRSQVSTLTISRHSSGDSEKSYSRSVVIRSQDHRFKAPKKFEQILNAREAKVVARQNCVEDWIAWHARLKARENRVARMEEATYKLFNASNPASFNDVTVSSDASEVAGRVELLSKELAEKKAVLVKLSKKQTKQKLKALEADLLNKIKKYDTTINEMQKKIETNRVVSKKSGKLAIEAKALADVKVPEIPIKRIQELYKNNDLLRSCSESDLFVDFTNPKTQISSESTQTTDKIKKPSNHSIESVLSERKNISEIKSLSNIDDESNNTKKYTDNNTTTTTKTKTKLTDELKNSKSLMNKINYGHSNDNENLDDPISTLKNDLKTLSEIMSNFSKKSDEKLRSVLLTSTHEETPKSTSRDITDDLLKSSQTTSTIEPESIPEILTYNNKKSIDTTSSLVLQNNNDSNDKNDVIAINLNKDNDTSSEITSVDVTEVISGIIPSQEFTKISEEIDFTARSKAMLSEIEKSIILDKSLVNNGGKNLELSGAKLEKSMDDLHKENEALSTDFNIIEGDIQSISEIISKMSENNQSLSDYKCHLSNKHSSTENINSFIDDESKNYEIISEKDVNISYDNQDNLSIDKQSETITSIDNNNYHDDDNEDEIEEEIEASEINEAGNESSLESTKISHHENSSKIHENSKNESDWTISDSFEIQENHSNIINNNDNSNEQQIELNFDDNKLIKNINSSFNYQNFDNDIDASYFVPNCESTNIGNTMLNDQETDLSIMIQKNTSQTDELDDILEIIENDCKKMDLKNKEKINNINNVPGELQLEIKNNNIGVTVFSPELSLTTDVEPALKQLTEVLRSVERNIEKRTQSIETEKQDDIQDPVGSESTENDVEQITSKSTDNNQFKNKKVSFSDKISSEIDFRDKALVETNIDEKIEINRHLDEALDRLSISEDNDSHHENLNDNNNLTFITNDCSENDVIFKKPINKIQEILRDPEYEDISEESMEVSEILDRSISSSSHKSSKIPDKYEKIIKTDDVLRILDEISQKKDNNLSFIPQDLSKIPPLLSSSSSSSLLNENNQATIENIDETKIINESEKIDDKSFENLRNIEDTTDDSSEEQETPREISEINMDSPRDQNSSRLDIETLDDDLLTPTSPENINNKLEYHTARPQTESEKDIENMIDKLRASLNTPGLDVAIIDARLLRIEELQIELQIKKLEAEEVSYYVREIPNKPPPPYTPPCGPKTSSRLKNLPATVIPNNIDELTNFTEKATMFIYHEKQSGNDILMLDAPEEICETTNNNITNTDNKIIDKNTKDDKKIYNKFLFDLCKETVADIYQSEYEKPGPSWTKPNYKTKTIVKLPKNIDELNEHVCKEVATLFGFKTKMQRENMVMRWSRKKGDRVDELLAREIQAEEDEWTKFHHDELAVKNELTIAIFNTLIMETTSVVKAAYAKKRKVMI